MKKDKLLLVLILCVNIAYAQQANIYDLKYSVLNPIAAAGAVSSGIATGNNKAFYIDHNGYLTCLWWTGNSWNNSIIDISAPKAKINSEIIYDQVADKVFFITNNNKLANFWWNQALEKYVFNYLNINAPTVHNSQFSLEYGPDKIFYINSSNQVFCLYFNGSVWNQGYIFSHPSASIATSMAYDEATDKLFYVATDRRIVNLWWNISLPNPNYSSGYLDYNTTHKVMPGGAIAFGDGKVFFVTD